MIKHSHSVLLEMEYGGFIDAALTQFKASLSLITAIGTFGMEEIFNHRNRDQLHQFVRVDVIIKRDFSPDCIYIKFCRLTAFFNGKLKLTVAQQKKNKQTFQRH